MEAYKSALSAKQGPKVKDETFKKIEKPNCPKKNVLSTSLNSFYIPVEINNIKLNMLVDKGSLVSIMSDE